MATRRRQTKEPEQQAKVIRPEFGRVADPMEPLYGQTQDLLEAAVKAVGARREKLLGAAKAAVELHSKMNGENPSTAPLTTRVDSTLDDSGPTPTPCEVEEMNAPGESLDGSDGWLTGAIPDRSGALAYVEIFRHPDDPERTPRELRSRDVTRWRRELRAHASVWGPRLLQHLGDGAARTLNRLAVEVVDFTADVVLGTPLAEALWALVEAGAVEYTPQAPVFFRYRGAPVASPDYEEAMRRVVRDGAEE